MLTMIRKTRKEFTKLRQDTAEHCMLFYKLPPHTDHSPEQAGACNYHVKCLSERVCKKIKICETSTVHTVPASFPLSSLPSYLLTLSKNIINAFQDGLCVF